MPLLTTVDRAGAGVLNFLEFTGAMASFGGRALVEAFRPPYEPGEIIRHIYSFGYRSAPLVGTAGLAIGVVLSMHTRASLERFGAEAMIPAGLAIAMIRETGPLTAALLVSGRVGAGIGAELPTPETVREYDDMFSSRRILARKKGSSERGMHAENVEHVGRHLNDVDVGRRPIVRLESISSECDASHRRHRCLRGAVVDDVCRGHLRA